MSPSESVHMPEHGALPQQPPSGHVYRVERKRGPGWYAKYRLPDGRQVKRKLGPAWSERQRPPAGYFTKRLAEAWLRQTLDKARCGTLHELVRAGVTVDETADEYLRYIEHGRERKPSTVQGYRWVVDAQIRPAFGPMRLEELTQRHVERWLASIAGKPSTRTKALVLLAGVLERARKLHGLASNPARGVEKPRLSRSLDIEVLSPGEVRALGRAAACRARVTRPRAGEDPAHEQEPRLMIGPAGCGT